MRLQCLAVPHITSWFFTSFAIQFFHTDAAFKGHTLLISFSFPTASEIPFLQFLPFYSLPSHFALSFFFLFGSFRLFKFPLLQPASAFPCAQNQLASVNRILTVGLVKVMEDDQILGRSSVRAGKSKEFLACLCSADVPPACKIDCVVKGEVDFECKAKAVFPTS